MQSKLLNGIRFCSKCGSRILFQGYNVSQRIGNIMDKTKVCFDCAYWEELIKYPPQHLEVVGDRLLKVFPEVQHPCRSQILGGNGKMRYFIKANGELVCSNDVWNVATIPDKYKAHFPPTLKEISRTIYNRIQKYPAKCTAKGCYDRYFCWRYDVAIETAAGPYNIIPKNWMAGNEKCKYFIDKRI